MNVIGKKKLCIVSSVNGSAIVLPFGFRTFYRYTLIISPNKSVFNTG
jgi:hypothetical protein